jgi:CRP-like cAMP-binding protein
VVEASGRDGEPCDGRGADKRFCGNQILALLPADAFDAIGPHMDEVDLQAGACLFEPGDDVAHAYFPLNGTVLGLVLPMRDGKAVEAATIGREGSAGGVISLGLKPAFGRALVHIGGRAARIPVMRLEAGKRAAPRLHDILLRYADCFTAQVMQSVACATLHPLEARCARWLLTMHDRLQQPELPLTQEMLAEMFGVARTYVTRIASALQKKGAISYRRGLIRVERRAVLEEATCECYGAVRRHFDRILPGLYPEWEP